MAIVMVIIGLIVGFGASLVGPLSIRAKRIEGAESVDAGVEAIVGHAVASEGALPTLAQFPGIIRTRNDAWTRPIQYVVDAACTTPVTVVNVAFLVLSGGENFNNQTVGTLAAGAATVIDVYPNGVGNVDGYAADVNRAEPYDDIVQWATLDELRSRIGCRGPPLAVLNNELPPGRCGNPYSAAAYVEGGVPFAVGGDYLWCIETPRGAIPSHLNFRTHSGSGSIGFHTNGAGLAESSSVCRSGGYDQAIGPFDRLEEQFEIVVF